MSPVKQLKPVFRAPSKHKVRKHLSQDAMISSLRENFEAIPDPRQREGRVSLPDALMSGYAVFALKDPSLLAFEQRCKDDAGNFLRVFGIKNVLSDTQMRDVLDLVKPELLRPLFCNIFDKLQQGKALEPLTYYEGCFLLSMDGTGYQSSGKLTSAACLEKTHRSGKRTYYQQMLGAAIVHPDYREVIPFAPEMIVKQDGSTKNDCERNAAKRFLAKFRAEHPRLGVIVIEDGISSNGPHISDLQDNGMHFILGAKPGDHPLLFDNLSEAVNRGTATTFTQIDHKKPEIIHSFCYLNGTSLNQAHLDLKVNFLFYEEYNTRTKKLQRFSWVTDFPITEDNAYILMRGGRCRWKIENETFNTLKNQGYHFEHNYGLGKKHLREVFVMLMMLAFLVDQTQQLTCALFQAAWHKRKSKRALWENVRHLFHSFEVESMEMIYRAIANGFKKSALELHEE